MKRQNEDGTSNANNLNDWIVGIGKINVKNFMQQGKHTGGYKNKMFEVFYLTEDEVVYLDSILKDKGLSDKVTITEEKLGGKNVYFWRCTWNHLLYKE